jgi:hypothetical protein
MKSVSRFAALLVVWTFVGAGLARAQTARDRAVELTSVVQETPPAITLQWTATADTLTSQKVARRLKDRAVWTELATPANDATSYTDAAVTAGVSYEYRVSRTFSGGPGVAHGYVSAGIRVPSVAERGKVILLVDDAVATPLAPSLAIFESDLAGDGWTVIRQDVSRTAAPPSVRAAVQSIYSADPTSTRVLILFGHIPVPYSGNFAIDGHADHFGAWPTDIYYGDMDGVWTDSTVDTTLDANPEPPRTTNIPGDGKFDQIIIPSEIELQVGRIDMTDLPAFRVGDETDTQTEIRLLQQYLDRDHQYRHRLAPYDSVSRRALVDDNFGFANGEAFAATAWRSFTACVGAGNVQESDWFGTLAGQSCLWAYGCGPGSFVSAGGVGATSDFANIDSLAVFNVLFGSYFGDWDVSDSFLRAPLAGRPASLGLVSCWAGRPHWVFHPMALGETVGYCARLTQNNDSSAGYDANIGERLNHIALLGDPTLRLYPVAPPSNLSASATGQSVTLTWTTSADPALEGYLISRATSPAGPFTRLRAALVAGTNFVDRSVTPGANYSYLVRAVKNETSPTGTYLNPSQGTFSAAAISAAAAGAEVDISGNGKPVSAGDTEPMLPNGTDFGSAETTSAVVHTFTMTNAGASTLNITSAQMSGVNANDFTLVGALPGSLAPGGSVNFQIQFHPAATGQRAAIFTVTSDDADEGSYAFALGGAGIPPHAEIAIYPPAINRSIHADDFVTETITISDPGPGPLVHEITSSLARYSARDSDSFAGPAFNWIDVSASGAEITSLANTDDAISAPLAIGFSFPFYGSAFTSLRVCSNGFLSFTDTSTSAANSALPAPGAPANLVAPFWSDLLVDAASHIFAGNAAGNFVVQFQNVGFYGNSNGRLTCEVTLKPTGEILFQYQTLTQTGSTYTIGIQNAARDEGLLVACNVAYAHAGMAIRIRPPGLEKWLTLDTNSGTVAPGGQQQIVAMLDAAGLALGDYYGELTINSNAQGNTAVLLPVRLTIGNTPVENWRLQHFNTTADSGDAGDGADSDRDGRPNVLEYALATDPAAFDAGGAPAIDVNSSGYLQIQFPRDTTHTDLRYLVEATSDLATSWNIIASSTHGAPVIATGARSSIEVGSSDVKSVTVEDVAPISTFATRYLRLRILRD